MYTPTPAPARRLHPIVPASVALLAVLLAIAFVSLGCPGSLPSPSTLGKPDAGFALKARTAIDASRVIRLTTVRWAAAQVAHGTRTPAEGELVVVAAEVLEGAEDIANAQLDVYLATGGMDAALAVSDALAEVAKLKYALLKLRGDGGAPNAPGP